MLIFTISMTFAGSFGVPRRHWDITFSQAPFDVQFNPIVDLILAVVALGGLLAATGAFLFIAIAVKSVFFGEPLGEIVTGVATAGVPRGPHAPARARAGRRRAQRRAARSARAASWARRRARSCWCSSSSRRSSCTSS